MSLFLSTDQFLKRHALRPDNFMWFLGAGASRSAGLPSASDIVFNLKRRIYAREENQDASRIDMSNCAIRKTVDQYFEARSCPTPWSDAEYSFYFDQMFGDDYGQQQAYISDQFNSDRVALTAGLRAFGGLIGMGLTKVVFTTNFDDVVETSVSHVAGKNLTAFHLEGSVWAIDALNRSQFPLYVKLHGDFRFRSLKNLDKDLQANDASLRQCFLAAATRFGMIVSGYSGRDQNIRAMFSEAIQQSNAFPGGLYWAVLSEAHVPDAVREIVLEAQRLGIEAAIVETGPHDALLNRLWRSIDNKPDEIDRRVRGRAARKASIELPAPGSMAPLIRTNAFPIIVLPDQCGSIPAAKSLAYDKLRERRERHRPQAIVTQTDEFLFFGAVSEVAPLVGIENAEAQCLKLPTDPAEIASNTRLKSFYAEALANALCWKKPLRVRKKGRRWYCVVNSKSAQETLFEPLRSVVGGPICGSFGGRDIALWADSVSIRLDFRGGKPWLLLKPEVWVTPLKSREVHADFCKSRYLKFYNNRQYELLDAWGQILFGEMGSAANVDLSCYTDADYPAQFSVNTRSAFSRRGAA